MRHFPLPDEVAGALNEGERRAAAEHPEHQRRQGEGATLAVIIGSQQEGDVLEGDDNEQGRKNKGKNAIDCHISQDTISANCGRHGQAHSIERAGIDVA